MFLVLNSHWLIGVFLQCISCNVCVNLHILYITVGFFWTTRMNLILWIYLLFSVMVWLLTLCCPSSQSPYTTKGHHWISQGSNTTNCSCQCSGSWAGPYGSNGQVNIIVHNYRHRKFQKTSNGEIRPAVSKICILQSGPLWYQILQAFGPWANPYDHDITQLQV